MVLAAVLVLLVAFPSAFQGSCLRTVKNFGHSLCKMVFLWRNSFDCGSGYTAGGNDACGEQGDGGEAFGAQGGSPSNDHRAGQSAAEVGVPPTGLGYADLALSLCT